VIGDRPIIGLPGIAEAAGLPLLIMLPVAGTDGLMSAGYDSDSCLWLAERSGSGRPDGAPSSGLDCSDSENLSSPLCQCY